MVHHNESTALYRLWGTNDILLYVGISRSPMSRVAGHRRLQPWAILIDDHEWQWHDSRFSALHAETIAIRDEAPLFNIDGNDNRERPWFWMVRSAPPTLDWRMRLTDFAYVVKAEPRLLVLLEKVRRMRGDCGECCWDEVRQEARQLVGWYASAPDVQGSFAYEVTMTTLWEALPWTVCPEHEFVVA